MVKTTDPLGRWEEPVLVYEAKVTVSATQPGQESGLIVMGLDYARLAVEFDGTKFAVKMVECQRANKNKPETSATVATLDPTRIKGEGGRASYDIELWLRVKVERDYKCTFYYSTDGRRYHKCPGDFTAREGHWIGARVGFFSIMPQGRNRGWMDIDWFRVTR